MGESEQRIIARRILAALYNDWEHHTGSSLHPIQEEGGWDKETFNEVIRILRDRGFVETPGNMVRITASGVLKTEEAGAAPEERVELHGKIRAHILKYLVALRDREGSRAHHRYEKIGEEGPVEAFEMLVDLSLLTNLGQVESVAVGTYKITDEGLREYRGGDYEDII
jgi:superfamily II helicase